MNENVRKIFDMLGIKPCVWFRVDGIKEKMFINEDLIIEDEEGFFRDKLLRPILTGQYKIIKRSDKQHVGDLTCRMIDCCKHCPLYIINCTVGDDSRTLYEKLEQHYLRFQNKEIYDFLKKRLDEELENV